MKTKISVSVFCTIICVIVSSVQAELRHLIESPKASDWGTWGEIDRCPPLTFATGMQLKVEDGKGWKDDTGLNGIKFFCSKLLGEDVSSEESEETFTTVNITSSVGRWGHWNRPFYCSDDSDMNRRMSAVVGFQLRSEFPKSGIDDDTSANNLRIICADFSVESNTFSSVIEGDGTKWGTWTESQFCKRGYAVCGIVTQVDHGQEGKYDDTALNNVKAECCKIEFWTEEDLHPTSSRDPAFPDPIESARNLEKDLQRPKMPIIAPTAGIPQSEQFPDRPILSFSPDVVYDAPEINHPPIEEVEKKIEYDSRTPTPLDHVVATHEINRLADLDFGTPDIAVTIKVPVINESEGSTKGSLDVPPEVRKFLETEEKDPDPDPSHVNIISGRIHSEIPNNDLSNGTILSSGANHEAHVNNEIPVSSSSISVSIPFLCLFLLFIRPICFSIIF